MYASIILKKVVCLCCKMRWNKIYRISVPFQRNCVHTCVRKRKKVCATRKKLRVFVKKLLDITRKIFTPSLAYVLVFLPSLYEFV